MSDRLSSDAVAKVARLARLELSPDELDRATHQLSDMLGHFDDIASGRDKAHGYNRRRH